MDLGTLFVDRCLRVECCSPSWGFSADGFGPIQTSRTAAGSVTIYPYK